MFYRHLVLLCCLWMSAPLQAQDAPNNTQLSVWANEAIIATFTYNYQDFLPQQKEIATYFTGDGWLRYSKALLDAKLPDTIKTNAYYVSAVATMPPEITKVDDHEWQAVMPVLVVYTNPAYKQKQSLAITVTFIEAPTGTGVRGFAITNLKAVVVKPPCECAAKEEKFKAVG